MELVSVACTVPLDTHNSRPGGKHLSAPPTAPPERESRSTEA